VAEYAGIRVQPHKDFLQATGGLAQGVPRLFPNKKVKIFFEKTGNRFSACYFLCNLF